MDSVTALGCTRARRVSRSRRPSLTRHCRACSRVQSPREAHLASASAAAAGARPGVAIVGGRLERLASGLPNQRLRGLVLTLAPGRDTGPEPIRHPGQELVVGLEGTCVYEVDGQPFQLGAGDSLLFESARPHRAVNPGTGSARLLLALYAPEEEPRWIERHVAPETTGAPPR